MSTSAIDDLAELVQGMGQASPGPLFLIDELGNSHPLNGLAEQLGGADASEQAFVSPVHLGAGSQGRVVGFAPPTGEARDEALVSALVALVAGVVSERFAASPGPVARPPRRRDPLTAVDLACAELGTVCDEQRVGEIVLGAALAVLRGRSAALFVRRRDDDHLEPIAEAGFGSRRPGPATVGRGLIGWAGTLAQPLLVAGARSLPDEAPAAARAATEAAEPHAPPLALLPLRCGPELAGVLVVSGLPEAALDPTLAAAAMARLERLLDKAAANLAGLRILRQVRREERVRRELEIARQIQSGLLPAGEIRHGDLQLAGECRAAAQVGGDWFGHEVDAGGRLSLTLFDVAGHGIGAAVAMTMVRAALQSELARAVHPAEALTRANRHVFADLSGAKLFATAFACRFDPAGQSLEYASAGHAPPIHWSAAERSFVERPEGGVPLGLLEGGDYPAAATTFGPGDLLVAYTDGISEARSPSGEKFGRRRLLGALRRRRRRSAAAILRGLRRELERFTQGRALQDDATLVVVKRACPPGPWAREEDETDPRSESVSEGRQQRASRDECDDDAPETGRHP
jgi:serine phosphatase RsbU (regulator of sigma subunit)